MKISHIKFKDRPSSIIVRNYDNKSIVHVPNYIIREYYKPLEDEIGQFRIKYKDKCFGHFAQRFVALSCCRKNTPKTLNLRQIMKAKNNVTVQDQDGNSTKPLLCDGLMTEDLIIKMNKKHLVMLYDFAYKLAKKAGVKKVEKLKEIDLLINSRSYE